MLRELVRAVRGVAKVIGSNLIALAELVGNVVEERPEIAMQADKPGQMFFHVLIGLWIIHTGVTDPEVQIVAIELDLIQ